ncbi:MAG: hypothetical protein AAF211_07525 [Myxococcota bacterium]
MLVDAIARVPGDERRWLVLGDALQEWGDPRGELVALTSAEAERMRTRPFRHAPEIPPLVRARVAALTDEAAWLADLGLPPLASRHVGWHRGLVERLSIEGGSIAEALDLLDALWGHWSGRRCARLWLDVASDRDLVRLLVSHPGFQQLRALAIHEPSMLDAVIDSELQLEELTLRGFSLSDAQLTRLLRAPWVSGLHTLKLRVALPVGHGRPLAACPALRSLRWLDGPLDGGSLRRSPFLERCHVYVWRPDTLRLGGKAAASVPG